MLTCSRQCALNPDQLPAPLSGGRPSGPATSGDSRPRLCARPESLPAATSRSHSEGASLPLSQDHF